MRAARAAAWALAVAQACVAPPSESTAPATSEAREAPAERAEAAHSSAASAPAAAPARAATRRRASGDVEILLSALAGREEITVVDPREGRVTLSRSGELVRGGTSARASWTLSPAPGSPALEVDGRSYPGALTVQPRALGGLDVRARVDLEDYVAGVLASEVSVWSAPPALLEAQAVAARSYAVAELDHRARSSARAYLFDDTRDQAYAGDPPAGRAAAAVRAAVERTRGLILREGDFVVDARYHAACGGRTADGRSVFPEADFQSLRGVDCPPCAGLRGTPRDSTWETTLSRSTLDALAQSAGVGAPLRGFEPAEVDAGGRWIAATLTGAAGSARVEFARVRRASGSSGIHSSLLRSTWPRPGAPIEGGLYLSGRGRGHGVGLCQEGARGLAEQGWDARRILAHYYPGARLVDGR
jgi:stage II sporulation protein D